MQLYLNIMGLYRISAGMMCQNCNKSQRNACEISGGRGEMYECLISLFRFTYGLDEIIETV